MQQKTATNILLYGECLCLLHCQHLYSLGKITQTICIPSKIQKISQWNKCSTYLRNWHSKNQTRSMEQIQLPGNTFHGSIYLWFSMKKLSVSCTQRSTNSQILYYAFERWTRTHNQTLHGKTDWRGSKVHQGTEHWTKLMVNHWNSSEIFCHDSPHCSCAAKVQKFLSRLSVEPEKFTGRIILMSMFNDISWGSKDNKKECKSSAQLVFLYAKRFGARQWSFLGPGLEKKWYFTSEDSPQGEWDRIAEHMMLTFAESKHPVFRSTSPLSRGVLKSKGGGKMSIHYCNDPGTIETVFRTFFVNKLSIYGAVADMREECESYHDRTGRPDVEKQSNPLFVPSVMKTHTPLTDDSAQQEEDLLQRYKERFKSYHNKIEWVNFVLMQDSWPQFKSDSISWWKTLKNSHNSQI